MTPGDSGGEVPRESGKSLISKKGLKIAALAATAALTATVTWVVKETVPFAADKITKQPVVRATAQYDKSWLSDGWSMVTDGPLDAEAVPTSVTTCETFREWLTDTGAADLGSSHLRLHLQGTRAQTATVTDLRARVISRSAPRKGAKATCPSAGEQGAQRVKLNLDQRTPSANALSDKGEPTGPYFQSHTVTLTKGEPLDFVIEAEAKSSTVTWELELDVQLGNESTTVVVPGAAFVTTAVQSPDSYAEMWQWRWDLQPQRLERQSSTSGTSVPPTAVPSVTVPPKGEVAHLRPTAFAASASAAPAVDAGGRPVSYDPGLVGDDDPATAWRVPGEGANQWVELTFDAPVLVEEVGIIPGYSKTDPADRTNRFQQNRRIARARYVFDGGQAVVQALADRPDLQRLTLNAPIVTRHVRLEILGTTAPGDPAFDFTALSEFAVFGRPRT